MDIYCRKTIVKMTHDRNNQENKKVQYFYWAGYRRQRIFNYLAWERLEYMDKNYEWIQVGFYPQNLDPKWMVMA